MLAGRDRVVVAFSGGVDSGLLAWVAHDVLGPERTVAVTAVSPSLAPSERADCRRLAESWGLRWMEVVSDEGARPGYVANGPDRCYHCKSELMDRLAPVAEAEGAVIALGVNVDDLADHRPGQQAARERGAVFPLVEAGLTKDADPPGGPPAGAGRVGQARGGLPGFPGSLRHARHPGHLDPGGRGRGSPAGPRVPRAPRSSLSVTWPVWSSARPTSSGRSPTGPGVVAAVRAAGYRYVTLDLEGLRSGNLNDVLRDGPGAGSGDLPVERVRVGR